MTEQSDQFWNPMPPAQQDPLRDDLMGMILARHHATPRHRQIALGPSDVAHPCMRKIAYGLMAEDRINPEFDPLASIIGTAMHTWLQSAAEHANQILGWERWLTEQRVHVAPGLSGNSDLYDRATATVIDWKTASRERMARYRKDPGPQYKVQVQLYGKGFADTGLPVERVALCFIPRGMTLRSMHVWTDQYRPDVAEWALTRRDQAIALCQDFDVENSPEHYGWFPATPYDCEFCPWHGPKGGSPLHCKGDGS
jgi:hypothetical protein